MKPGLDHYLHPVLLLLTVALFGVTALTATQTTDTPPAQVAANTTPRAA